MYNRRKLNANLFFQKIALQLNSTYHKAIKAIPYEVHVYNLKPNYKRTIIELRQIIIDEVKEQEIDDEMNTSLIRDDVIQEEIDQRVQLQLDASDTADDPKYQEHVTNRLNYNSVENDASLRGTDDQTSLQPCLLDICAAPLYYIHGPETP